MTLSIQNKSIFGKCNSGIVITGGARGGTTILGKLVHSFKNVEYAFEPPQLITLLCLIRELSPHHWKLLYETYIFEEFLLPSLSGRAVNCNVFDDSSIFRVKAKEEIEKRLNASVGKKDLLVAAQDKQVAYKLPSITPFIPRLLEYYPGTKVIIIRRPAIDVFHSILAKKWFEKENFPLMWPIRVCDDGTAVPYWVEEESATYWNSLDELHKTAHYYITMNSNIEKLESFICVKYNQLIESPLETIQNLAQELNLEFGEKTDEILNTVKYRQHKKDANLLKKLSPKILEQVNYYSSKAEL